MVTRLCRSLFFVGLISNFAYAAEGEVWSIKNTPERALFNGKRLETKVSAAGISVGEPVIFRGVGRFFYVGWANGDIYVADIDEQGGHTFKDASQSCSYRNMSLPTIDQLDLLRINSRYLDDSEMNLRAASGVWYWSKTRYNKESLWAQRFSDGLQQPIKGKFVARVRCVKVY